MEFSDARTLVEFAAIFMVIMPLTVFGVIALKLHFQAKAKK